MLIRYADACACTFQSRKDATRFYEAMPERLEQFALAVALERTRILRFSRFHPGLRRRLGFLALELYWNRDRRGDLRVVKRTARKQLQGAKQDWMTTLLRGPNYRVYRRRPALDTRYL